MITKICVVVLLAVTSTVMGQASDCKAAGDFALTFDGGPGKFTGALLTALRASEAQATFHFTTKYFNNPVVKANARLAITDGHQVGLRLFEMGQAATKEEMTASIKDQIKVMYSTIGYSPKFVRARANDLANPVLFQVLKEMNLVLTSFNLDSMDYQAATSGDVIAAFRGQLDQIAAPALGSFISLQTDLVEQSVAATTGIVKMLKERNYKIVRLEKCLGVEGGMAPPEGVAPPVGMDPVDGDGTVTGLNDAPAMPKMTKVLAVMTCLAVAVSFYIV